MDLLSEKEFLCPYCGSRNAISLEGGQGQHYKLVTDCEICCRPIVIHVKGRDEDCDFEVHAENG